MKTKTTTAPDLFVDVRAPDVEPDFEPPYDRAELQAMRDRGEFGQNMTSIMRGIFDVFAAHRMTRDGDAQIQAAAALVAVAYLSAGRTQEAGLAKFHACFPPIAEYYGSQICVESPDDSPSKNSSH